MPARRTDAAAQGLRRRAVAAAFGAALLLPRSGQAQRTPAPGLVSPRLPAPDWPLTDTRGRRLGLATRLRGHVSAVQLMFAGCSTVCPLQGAIFAAAARRVSRPDVQLLSVTIDPLGDDVAALQAWQARFGSHPAWSAAVPRVAEVEAVASYLLGAAPKAGTHATRVFLFDREARLAFRTVDLPSADHLVDLLEQLARSGT